MRNIEAINADLTKTNAELTAVEQRFYQQQPVNEKLGRHMVDLRARIAGLYDELGRALCGAGPEAK